MTLREPRGDEIEEEELERLGIECDERSLQNGSFPPCPFLLIEEFKEKGNIYHVIESWKECDIQVLRDCHFMQNIGFIGHKASEEEIEKFLSEEDDRITVEEVIIR